MAIRGKELLAYMAGIIDGEGHIGIYGSFNHKLSKHKSHYLRVSVGNNCKELLDIFKAKLGGGLSSEQPPKGKLIWRWTITGNNAKQLLKDIYPYLVVKSKQASIGIEFQEKRTKRRTGKNGNELPESELKLREYYRLQLKQLNNRTIPPATTKREDVQISWAKR